MENNSAGAGEPDQSSIEAASYTAHAQIALFQLIARKATAVLKGTPASRAGKADESNGKNL